MSGGEFFDLIRPGFLIVSALLSIFVLANARRNGFRTLSAIIWALATFFLPLVILPLYLLLRIVSRSPQRDETPRSGSAVYQVSDRFLLPFFYGMALFAVIALSQYREYMATDAYLARARQAKLEGDRPRTIREYKAALAMEDDAHTHKLLGIELYDNGDWAAALSEFRLAERGGEEDETLPFRMAVTLELLNQPHQAEVEFKNFLYGAACAKEPPDHRCEIAAKKIADRK